mmetsp:Transcript_2733/g.13088  ORF Transcript_2733/g.13088 Transcript_2733/m.13088 type:complete len:321 (+) Transcript_2733:2476-3438(+)
MAAASRPFPTDTVSSRAGVVPSSTYTGTSLASGPGGTDARTACATSPSVPRIEDLQPSVLASISTSPPTPDVVATIATRSTVGSALASPSTNVRADASSSSRSVSVSVFVRFITWTPNGAKDGGARVSIALSMAATQAPNAIFIRCAPPLRSPASQFSASLPHTPSDILSHIISIASTRVSSSQPAVASTQRTPPAALRNAIWNPSSHETRLNDPVPVASAYAATDASSATVGKDGVATFPYVRVSKERPSGSTAHSSRGMATSQVPTKSGRVCQHNNGDFVSIFIESSVAKQRRGRALDGHHVDVRACPKDARQADDAK